MGRPMNDYAGQRFGKLTAIEFGHSASNNAYYWKFICDCGKSVITNLHDTRRGKIQSCGCIKRKLTDQELGFNRVLYTYKSNAKNHNREWSLSDEEFSILINQSCYYCGCSPSNNMQRSQGYPRIVSFMYNGVDRVDSSMGYTPNNVVSCCGVCNRMKLDTDQAEFIKRIKCIAQRFSEGSYE